MRIILALAMLLGGAGWMMKTAEAISIPDSVSIPVQVTRTSYNHALQLCDAYMHHKSEYFGVVSVELVAPTRGRTVVLPCEVVAAK